MSPKLLAKARKNPFVLIIAIFVMLFFIVPAVASAMTISAASLVLPVVIILILGTLAFYGELK